MRTPSQDNRIYIGGYGETLFPQENHPSRTMPTQKNWFEHALDLEIYHSNSKRLRRLVNTIFKEVSEIIKISNKNRSKEALKLVLINLYHARLLDMPVKYSRDRNFYVRDDARYKKLFFKYDRLIPIIDALETLGYINKIEGRFFHDKGFGRQTRMWGTPKLWSVFTYNFITPKTSSYHKSDREELIVLRDKTNHKNEIGYRETTQIRQWREDLKRYNRFIDKHVVSVRMDGSTKIDNWFLTQYLYYYTLNNNIKIDTIVFNNNSIVLNHKSYRYDKINQHPAITRIPLEYYQDKRLCPINKYKVAEDINKSTHQVIIKPPQEYTSNNDTKTTILDIIKSYTMTQMISPERLMNKLLQQSGRFDILLLRYLTDLCMTSTYTKTILETQDMLTGQFTLNDIGIERLSFTLNREHVHRVFNRKSFKKGGRAYGALHQNLPKHMRPHIHINDEKTTEVDYSAYHIRMLYHREGIDYKEDPYLVCGGSDLRDTFKAVGLIAINAEDIRSAYVVIRNDLETRGIPLPKIKKPLVWLVKTFRDAHKPISKYLFSDIGIDLMNIDSEIMNNILMRLMDKGILGLSVYDSVIVAERYADIVREIMVVEYEKVMKFKPVL